MSYRYLIKNGNYEYEVIFKDEKSFLWARLDWLQFYQIKSFLEYLQEEIYDPMRCEVENINAIFSPSESNNWTICKNTCEHPLQNDFYSLGYSPTYSLGNQSTDSSHTYYLSNQSIFSSGDNAYALGINDFSSPDQNNNINLDWDSNLKATCTFRNGHRCTLLEKEEKDESSEEEPFSRFDLLDL